MAKNDLQATIEISIAASKIFSFAAIPDDVAHLSSKSSLVPFIAAKCQ
jgi:hypothetical protein